MLARLIVATATLAALAATFAPVVLAGWRSP
jgi:hypothetical protein